MKRIFSLCIALTLGGVSLSSQADAQFWKKMFGKDNDRRPVSRKPAQRPGANAGSKKGGNQPGKKGPEPLKLAATVKKDRYRIDVLVPVYLNELVSGGKPVYKSHLPDKVLPGLSFYQGIRLASDTLDGQGYKLDVFIHDIADPTQTVDALLKANKLDSADLIIGAVQAPQVAPLAALARKRNINFVSTLSPADGAVRTNLYFNLIQPTLQRHCEAIRQAVAKKATPTTNLLLYHRSNVPVDEQCFRMLTKDTSFAYTKVTMNALMPAEKLRNFLDSATDNVIVMPVVDIAYATQLLEQLSKSFPAYHFEVYGMPSWKGIGLLRKEGALPNVGITIPAPFYFDASASAGRGFAEAFNEKFGGKPAELAYRGYEAMYWYAYLLQRYGTVFNEHFADNGVAPFTRFELKATPDKDGLTQYYENTHVYLYRYQGGSFSVEQ